ncbi:uncharacterized protein [Chironomus tepperi]|uniref:uncharacterized protein isoform X1 n=1 Tax=Chironomus tepperi TaxID=113505 RepID=UPI00391FA81B
MKSIRLTVLCLILHCSLSLSSTIDCKYRDATLIVLGRIYQCAVDNDPNITTQQSAQIDTFNGLHQRNKEDNDVVGFYASRKTIQYFPNGLQKFSDLKSIQILNCQLKEIHQTDLKPFADLTLIYMEGNLIQVLEEDLFAYNPNLKLIGFAQNNLVHIDPNVFDHLTQFSDFLFNGVPCVAWTIYGSVDKVKKAIKVVKDNCVSLEFLDLVAGVRKLEDQALTLSTEELKIKIQKLEKELKTFANFRPISYKLEKLRSLSNKTSAEPEHSTIKSDPMTTKSSENCFQTDQFAVLDAKFSNFSDNFSSEKTKSIKTVDDKLTGIKNTVNNLEIVQNKIVQDLTTAFIGTISLELKTTQESIKLLKNEVTSTVSDTVAAISDVKTNQIDIQATLSKLKTIQNDMKVSMNDLKALVMTNENCRENSENFEEKLANFEAVAVERFDKIENIMFNVGHKMSTNFDEKVKGIEKKMMKKFEELLQENLGKILEEKLEKVMNSRLGIK